MRQKTSVEIKLTDSYTHSKSSAVSTLNARSSNFSREMYKDMYCYNIPLLNCHVFDSQTNLDVNVV